MSKFIKIFFTVVLLVFCFVIFSENSYAKTTINAPFIKQLPELPRGCEVTSLAMMLQHAGVKVGKMELAKEVKKVPFSQNGLRGNPYDGFVGDMYSYNKPGLGVYHGPIQKLAEKYLPNRVVNLTGKDFSYVLRMLDKGQPVWVITNSWFQKLPDSQFSTWKTSTGPLKITYREHSVLVTGYDDQNIYINDPLYHKGNRAVNKKRFIDAWNQMGKQAISYYPKNANWYIDTIDHVKNPHIQQLASLGYLNDLKNGFYQPVQIVTRKSALELFSGLKGESVSLMSAPKGSLTRAELSEYIVDTFQIELTGNLSYPDVPSTHKSLAEIQTVSSLKIIMAKQGGFFKPNQTVTKAEVAEAVTRAMNLFWFRDTYTHWARDEISYLKRKGLISGMTLTKFGPNELITKAQAAVLIDRALKIKVEPFKKLSFLDVKTSNPAYTSISKMVQLGYMDKTEKFEPAKPIKRKEMAQLFAGSFGLSVPEKTFSFKDVPSNSKYFNSIQALAATRIISTGVPFNPEDELTRAQFAAILAKLLKSQKE